MSVEPIATAFPPLSTPVLKSPLRLIALVALPTSSGSGPEPALHPVTSAAPRATAPSNRLRFILGLLKLMFLALRLRRLGLLLDDVELDAAVLLAARVGVVVADRHVGAVALRGQAGLLDAAREERFQHGVRAILGEPFFERARAAAVGVALDLELQELRVPLQHAGDLV